MSVIAFPSVLSRCSSVVARGRHLEPAAQFGDRGMQLAALGLEPLCLLGEGQIMLASDVVGMVSGGDDRVAQLGSLRGGVALGGLERSQELRALADHLLAKASDRAVQLVDLVLVFRLGSLHRGVGCLLGGLERGSQGANVTLRRLQFEFLRLRHLHPPAVIMTSRWADVESPPTVAAHAVLDALRARSADLGRILAAARVRPDDKFWSSARTLGRSGQGFQPIEPRSVTGSPAPC
jgi:hypothetical protein